jgi:hypothetical protein
MYFHYLPCHVTHFQAAAVFRAREQLETADEMFRPYQPPPSHVKGMPSASEDAGIGGRFNKGSLQTKVPAASDKENAQETGQYSAHNLMGCLISVISLAG